MPTPNTPNTGQAPMMRPLGTMGDSNATARYGVDTGQVDNGMGGGPMIQEQLEPDVTGDMTNDAILRQTYAARRTWQFLVDSGQMDANALGASGETGMSATAEKKPPKVSKEPAKPTPASSANPESGRPAEEMLANPFGSMVMQAMEEGGWPIAEMKNWDGKTRASVSEILDILGRVLLQAISPKLMGGK